MRGDIIREQVHQLVHTQPFRPFVMYLENGQQVPIDHPENIAYDPDDSSEFKMKFTAVSRGRFFWGTFDAVSAVAEVDVGRMTA